MAPTLDALTEKEKETLRLMVKAHDAKSIARELDLSVYTINERLRAARRKLGVTSSREAARILLQTEAMASEKFVCKELGDASSHPESEDQVRSALLPPGVKRILVLGGMLMVSIAASVLLIIQAQTPVERSDVSPPIETENRADGAQLSQNQRELDSAERTALIMLEHADDERFPMEKGSVVTDYPDFAAWNALIARRQEVGKALNRQTHRIDIVERDGLDEWVVRFLTDFERFQGSYEKVTLARDEAGFIFKDYEIESAPKLKQRYGTDIFRGFARRTCPDASNGRAIASASRLSGSTVDELESRYTQRKTIPQPSPPPCSPTPAKCAARACREEPNARLRRG